MGTPAVAPVGLTSTQLAQKMAPAVPSASPAPPMPAGGSPALPPMTNYDELHQQGLAAKLGVQQGQSALANQPTQAAIDSDTLAIQHLAKSKLRGWMEGTSPDAYDPDELKDAVSTLTGLQRPGAKPAEKADKNIHSYTNAQGKQVVIFQKADGSTYEKTFGDVNQKDANLTDTERYIQQRNVLNDPTASPDAKKSAQAWLTGHAAFTKETKTEPGVARIQVLGETRPVQVLDTKNGNRPVVVSMEDINRANLQEPGRYLIAGVGQQALGKESLLQDIRGNIEQTRQAVSKMGKEAFDPGTRTMLAAGLADPKSTAMQLLQSVPRGALTPAQEDYVISLYQLRENAMAMRSVLGAGQGSDDLRQAIMATLPGAGTPTAVYANKQLDAFQKTLDRLGRGIPNVPLKGAPAGGTGSTTTHNFSVSAWTTANPKGDINAAVKKAASMGYTIVP